MKFNFLFRNLAIISTQVLILSFAVSQGWAATNPQFSDLVLLDRQVHDFYQNAWSDLMIFISVAIFVIGIVMPLIVTFFQNNSFKLQKQEMREITEGSKNEILSSTRKMINDEIEKLKIALADIEKSSESKLNLLVEEKSAEITKDINENEGKIFHVQGNVNHANKEYSKAIDSYLMALGCYFLAEDDLNFGYTVDNLESSLKINASNKFEEKSKNRLQRLILQLEKPGKSEMFKKYLSRIKEIKVP